MSDLSTLRECAYRIRRYALRMGEVQGQGYIGQALGWADVLAVAYGHAMKYKPEEPKWEGRDRFLLSHGHYAIAAYAAKPKSYLRKNSKPTAAMTVGCQCLEWSVTHQAWKCRVGHLGRDWLSASAWHWGCALKAVHHSSTTRCLTVSSMKDRPGKRRWAPRIIS